MQIGNHGEWVSRSENFRDYRRPRNLTVVVPYGAGVVNGNVVEVGPVLDVVVLEEEVGTGS